MDTRVKYAITALAIFLLAASAATLGVMAWLSDEDCESRRYTCTVMPLNDKGECLYWASDADNTTCQIGVCPFNGPGDFDCYRRLSDDNRRCFQELCNHEPGLVAGTIVSAMVAGMAWVLALMYAIVKCCEKHYGDG